VILVVSCGALLLFGWSGTGWKALIVPTASMRPAIPPGSLILTHRVSTASLEVGDIITYVNPLNPKTTISHRIIREYLIGNKVPAFITKGDANKSPDRPLTASSVVGKVIWHIPNVGSWLLFIKRPIVILPVIYLAALILMIEEVRRLSDYLKLRQPYRILGYRRYLQHQTGIAQRFTFGVIMSIFSLVLIGSFTGSTALASIKSNPVSLTGNKISAVAANQCSENNNSVIINNNSSQTATSGSASGGNASSGSVSNQNSTNVNVSISNSNCS
jgi:signal peptidase I